MTCRRPYEAGSAEYSLAAPVLREPARNAAAPARRRRRQLRRGGARPGDQPALRPDVGGRLAELGLRDRARPAAGRCCPHEQLLARRLRRDLPGAWRLRTARSAAGWARSRLSSRRIRAWRPSTSTRGRSPGVYDSARGAASCARTRCCAAWTCPSASARPAPQPPGHRRRARIPRRRPVALARPSTPRRAARVTRAATEFRTSSNPMTYRSCAGLQFIVIATGAGPDARLVAFALPERAVAP